MKTILKTGFAILTVLVAFSAVAQKKTQNFTVSRVINAPADKVWAVVGEDFGAIANSHPQIVSSNYINGTLKSGEGAERVCNFNDKGTKYVKEKQIEYDPTNYTFKVVIYHAGGVPMDAENTQAIYKVVPIDDNSCKFVMDMNYRTKPAFMGSMFKGKFVKTIEDYALAIEHHTTTGETVNKDNFKDIKKKYKG